MIRTVLLGVLSAFVFIHGAVGAAPKSDLPAARTLSPKPFERTPERVARGRYLAEGVLQCLVCHSEREWDQPGAPPKAGMIGAGQIISDQPDHRIVAPNLTPDRETGSGAWPDDALARAIREGVGHDGRALHPQMWYRSFRRLSDNDVAAVVVYLRTLAPVHRELPATQWDPKQRARVAQGLKPLTAPVPDPGAGPLDRGRYFVLLADCQGCHTSWYSKRQPGLYGGGNLIERGKRKAFSTNITADPSGVMADRTGFINLMRSGKNGSLSPLMPWVVFRNLDDDDLDAIRLVLAGLPPVSHYISNALAPTHCPVCQQEHGLGDANRLVEPAAKVQLDATQLQALAGSYRAREDGAIQVIRVADGKLYEGEKDDERVELVAQTPTSFKGSGLLLPVHFELDASGRAVRLVEDDLEPYVYDRVDTGGAKQGKH
jgi:mono/diheme cytochrome c family protein